MNNHDIVESEIGDLTCAVCLDNIKNVNYALTDDPADKNAKCCVKCIKEQVEQNKVSLIGRKSVRSYTIYSPTGKIIQNVIVKKGDPVSEAVLMIKANQVQSTVHEMPNRYHSCNKWMKLNLIIAGLLWIIGMTLFTALYTTKIIDTNIAFVMLGLAFAALIIGIIVHGILECCEINRTRDLFI